MTLFEITQKIAQDLAQASSALVSAGALMEDGSLYVDQKVVIQDDIILYEDIMQLSSQRIVPAVLKVGRSFITESHFSETLNGILWFYVPIEKRDYMYKLLDYYRELENDEKHELFEGYLIAKTVQRYTFDEYKKAQNGLDDMMFVLRMEFTWHMSAEFVTGKHITLEVKTGADASYTEIPYATWNMANDKRYVPNASQGTNEYLTDDTVTLNVPLTLGNAKVLEMYEDVDNNSYNKIYTFRLTVGTSVKVKELVLKHGSYIFENSNKIVGMMLRFGAEYARETVTIDGVTLKALDYSYTLTAERKAKRVGNVNKGQNTTYTRAWGMTFIDDGSTKFNQLLGEIYGTPTTHTLNVKGTNYSVEIARGVEGYKETRTAITLSLEEV